MSKKVIAVLVAAAAVAAVAYVVKKAGEDEYSEYPDNYPFDDDAAKGE